MSDVINLNKMRKQRKKSAEEKQAHENRIRFGRTKAEKSLTQGENKLLAKRLEIKKLDPE